MEFCIHKWNGQALWQFPNFEIFERDRVALGFQADVALVEAHLGCIHDLAIHSESAGAADAANVVDVPFSGRLDPILLHVLFQVEVRELPIDRSLAEDVSAIELSLSLVPNGTVEIVTEEDPAVVFGVGGGDRRKAPLNVKGEVREFVVEAQPFVAGVAVADDPPVHGINVPLRDLADGVVRRDGHSRPRVLLIGGKEVNVLSGGGQASEQKRKARKKDQSGNSTVSGFPGFA